MGRRKFFCNFTPTMQEGMNNLFPNNKSTGTYMRNYNFTFTAITLQCSNFYYKTILHSVKLSGG